MEAILHFLGLCGDSGIHLDLSDIFLSNAIDFNYFYFYLRNLIK